MYSTTVGEHVSKSASQFCALGFEGISLQYEMQLFSMHASIVHTKIRLCSFCAWGFEGISCIPIVSKLLI